MSDDAKRAVSTQSSSSPSSSRWLSPLALVAAGALVVFGPLKWPCPVAAIFGVPCPTCGMTRATRSVLHGSFGEATAMHPLVWIVMPWLGVIFALEAVSYVRTGTWGGSRRAIPRSGSVTLAIAVLVFVVWIARFFGALGGPVPV